VTTAWTIDGVRTALTGKKISARELTAEFYKRIEARNPELNAFLALAPERARKQADKIDALIASGKPLPALAGVPIAVKDVISTRGIVTLAGRGCFKITCRLVITAAIERLDAAG
jgi:aspartyl-tRNA(Asn)/glutamyl-tRNA(Gln) amidotransferase subunit A